MEKNPTVDIYKYDIPVALCLKVQEEAPDNPLKMAVYATKFSTQNPDMLQFAWVCAVKMLKQRASTLERAVTSKQSVEMFREVQAMGFSPEEAKALLAAAVEARKKAEEERKAEV